MKRRKALSSSSVWGGCSEGQEQQHYSLAFSHDGGDGLP